MSSYEATQRKRIAIIGANPAGISAAYSLSRHPDRFSVTIFEQSPSVGGTSSSIPLAFPHLSLLHKVCVAAAQSSGNVTLRTQRQVTRVVRADHAYTPLHGSPKSNVQLWSRSMGGTDEEQRVLGAEACEEFDELIMAVDADSALKILGENVNWLEKEMLGNTKYLQDVSIAHSDLDSMDKYYCLRYGHELDFFRTDEDAKKAYEIAQKEFAALYFIRSYLDDKKKVDTGFDLVNCQPQFKGEDPCGPSSTGPPPALPPPLSSHVFQTIFLDRDGNSKELSKGDIKPGSVICDKDKLWIQQNHWWWQDYPGTRPVLVNINGKYRMLHPGASTILNMHEIAVVSGLAAAYRVGADYPFIQDEGCNRLFRSRA